MQPFLSRRFVPAVTQYPEKPVGWCHPIDFPICAIYTRLAWIFCFGCAHTVYRTKLFLSGRTLSHRHWCINIAIKHRCFILIHQEYRKLSLQCAVLKLVAVLWISSRRPVRLRAVGVQKSARNFWIKSWRMFVVTWQSDKGTLDYFAFKWYFLVCWYLFTETVTLKVIVAMPVYRNVLWRNYERSDAVLICFFITGPCNPFEKGFSNCHTSKWAAVLICKYYTVRFLCAVLELAIVIVWKQTEYRLGFLVLLCPWHSMANPVLVSVVYIVT
jgi:hypothetical protein